MWYLVARVRITHTQLRHRRALDPQNALHFWPAKDTAPKTYGTPAPRISKKAPLTELAEGAAQELEDVVERVVVGQREDAYLA